MRARKRMTAVTRTIRGARRTGQRFGCSHPKCRCGFYRCASRRSASPYFWRQTFRAVAWQSSGARKRVARMMSFIRPRDSGGGGPSCAARWWKGASVDASFASKEIHRRRRTPPPRCCAARSPSPAVAGADKRELPRFCRRLRANGGPSVQGLACGNLAKGSLSRQRSRCVTPIRPIKHSMELT